MSKKAKHLFVSVEVDCDLLIPIDTTHRLKIERRLQEEFESALSIVLDELDTEADELYPVLIDEVALTAIEEESESPSG